MSGGEQTTKRWAARRIVLAFGISALGSAGFGAVYVIGAGPQAEGLALAVAFAGIAYGLSAWAANLLPSGSYVEEHKPFSSPPRERELLVESLTEPPSPISRKGLLAALGVALGTLGVVVLLPLRSWLGPRTPPPAQRLKHTPWDHRGLRLVDPEGKPIHIDQVSAETILTAYPQGFVGEPLAPVIVVRLDPARFTERPSGGDVHGVVAYSMVCTHAGCSVLLYEQSAARLLCPCHQSVFDLLANARPIFGPAPRRLPGLPIAVDARGYLYARGGLTSPPGPGFWSRP